jgi:glycosyltransferase involved in cell wall biosynthesis
MARLPFLGVERRLSGLLVAARRSNLRVVRRLLRRALAPWLVGDRAATWRRAGVGMARYHGSFGGFDGGPLTSSLVLKAPGPEGEKGVLYSAFEYNWVRLLNTPRVRELLQRYYLVGASSWSPTDYAVLTQFAGLCDDPVLMGISNPADIRHYTLMRPVVEALPLMACDWIDPAHYHPRPRDRRTIDILMVANWLPFKRHALLFEALRTMRRDLRIVLVGRDAPGRTADTVRREACLFGVRQELELLTSIGIDEVTRLQCDSRMTVLFSRREGSCVAVVESFFADTPVAMMRDAHVGAKAYVNAQTGILAARRGLGHQLSRLLEEGARYTPRAWALERVTFAHSCARLNRILQELAASRGRPWSTDIASFCWRPYPTYADATDAVRLGPAIEELREEFGVTLAEAGGPAPR